MGVVAPTSQRRLRVRCRAADVGRHSARTRQHRELPSPFFPLLLSLALDWAPTQGCRVPVAGASFSRSESRDCHAGGHRASAAAWALLRGS